MIVIAVVAMFPLTVVGALLALSTNSNDVAEWLPESFEATQDYRRFEATFGSEAFVLVSWQGCTLEDPRLREFASKLDAEEPHYFHEALTGPGMIDRLMSPPTSLSLDQAIGRLRGTFVGPNGEQSCAILSLTDLGRDNLHPALDQVYHVAVDEVGIPLESLHLGGPPVDNVAIDTEGERMLLPLMFLTGGVGLVLAGWFLRDVRLTIFVCFAGAYSAVLCFALVYLLGSTVDSVLLTMPAVVYTAGLAAAMHLINYYRHARVQGDEGAIQRGVEAAWLPCLLSAGTTAIGLVSLMIGDLRPIVKFGFFTALGVVAAVGLVFLFLPAALYLWPPKSHEGEPGADPRTVRHYARMRSVGEGIVGRARWVWAGFVLLIAIGLSGLVQARTTINLMSLFSPDAQIILSYQWLEEHLGPLVPMEIVVRFDPDAGDRSLVERMRIVEQVQDAAQDIDEVGGTLSAVTFAPNLAPKRSGLLRGSTYDDVLNRRLTAHRDELIDQGYLAEDEATGDELWRISLRVAALQDIDYGVFIHDVREHIEPVVDAHRGPEQGGLVDVTYTGMTPIVYMAERALMNGLIKSFGTAFVMIAVVMSLLFGDVRAGLLTMLPNVFPVAVVFGLMSWARVPLDIGTMMTASVAMGVCIDDTMHFAHWFRRATQNGAGRKQAVVMAFEHTAGVIYQSSAIVGLGLVTFALSAFMPTRRFGLLMFTLLSFGLLADLTLTPAMLSGWCGQFFERRHRRGKPEADAPAVAQDTHAG